MVIVKDGGSGILKSWKLTPWDDLRIMFAYFPAGTWRKNDVVLASMQRADVAST